MFLLRKKQRKMQEGLTGISPPAEAPSLGYSVENTDQGQGTYGHIWAFGLSGHVGFTWVIPACVTTFPVSLESRGSYYGQ